MSKSRRSLCVSFSRTGAGLCIYHLLVWSNLNFLHISLWINLPTQSCLVLYSFCANLQHSPIMCILLRLIYLRLDMIGSYSVVLPCPVSLVRDVVYSTFKTPIELFSFPFLFPGYCPFIIYRVVSIVFDGCNQTLFVFFYVVFESLYRSVNAVFDAGKSSSHLFSWYI